MCLRFVFLLTTRLAGWLRLSRREETWQTADILILRHQLAVLQRRQPRRPKLNRADRALLAALLGVIPKTRRHRLRLLVTPDTILRWHRDIVRRRRAAVRARQDRPPATRRNIKALAAGWPGRTQAGATSGSTARWPAWESRSRRQRYGESSRPAASAPPGTGPGRPGHSSWVLRPRRSWHVTSSTSTCPAAARPTSWP